MNGLRVVLITRRFWPLAEDVERSVARLATGLQQRAAQVTILTSRQCGQWSDRVDYQGVPVIRLPQPYRERWQALRYLVALGRWLRDHVDAIDVVCVSRLRSEAYTVLKALRGTRVPVVVRAEASGPHGDCQWQQRVRFGGRVRNRCQTAAASIATDEVVAEELTAAGYAAARVQLIRNGLLPAATVVASRLEARMMLAEVNPDLTVSAESPVVIYTGRLSTDAGLGRLLQAWRTVACRLPAARLWLLGEGPARSALRNHIIDLDLQRHVQMPGLFEDLEDVFPAANLYVDPGDEPGLPLPLLEAVAAGLPVVATQARQLLRGSHWSRGCCALVPAQEVEALSGAMLRLLAKPPHPETLAQASSSVLQQYSAAEMVEQHLRLFERLIREKQHGS